jgi:hypothetical protein
MRTSQRVSGLQAQKRVATLNRGEAGGRRESKIERIIGLLRRHFGKRLSKNLRQAIRRITQGRCLVQWLPTAVALGRVATCIRVGNPETSAQVLEWQAEAYLEGFIEGYINSRVGSIVRVLQLRFGKRLPRKLRQNVLASTDLDCLTDLDRLDEWFATAVLAPSLDAFRAATDL